MAEHGFRLDGLERRRIKMFGVPLEFFDAQLGQPLLVLRAIQHQFAHDAVGFPEGHAAFDKKVGEIGRFQKTVAAYEGLYRRLVGSR